MPTRSTCQQRSQSASASSSLRVVPNSRVSCCRPPLRDSLGTRIVTMIICLADVDPGDPLAEQRLVLDFLHRDLLR